MAPNEARFKENLVPVTGGESPMAQQQNFSLAALAKRDARPDPFATEKPAPAALPAPEPDDEDADEDDRACEPPEGDDGRAVTLSTLVLHE